MFETFEWSGEVGGDIMSRVREYWYDSAHRKIVFVFWQLKDKSMDSIIDNKQRKCDSWENLGAKLAKNQKSLGWISFVIEWCGIKNPLYDYYYNYALFA
jgi:hypothetical protein